MGIGATVALIKALAPATNPTEIEQIEQDVSDLKDDIDGILVSSGESVTLTNQENVSDFYTNKSGDLNGIQNKDGVASFKPSNSAGTSPYVMHSCAKGNGTWMVGFKFKFIKLNENLSDPDNFRVHMGASVSTDFAVEWDKWIEYANVETVDLTRIRIAARNFSSAPGQDDLRLEIKDMYCYNVASVSNIMRSHIISEQNSNYNDGTVTYTITGEKKPDTSLATQGKAADSKAVGDAIGRVRLNVKEHDVKGDGTTDDTNAINALFANSGVFYFPAGTYKITGTIALPSESELYGDGDQTVINMYSCDDLEEITFRGGDKIYPYILVDGKNTKLHDFKLTGNNTTETKRHCGILVVDTENCMINDVTVYNINYDGAQATDATKAYGISSLRSSRVYIDHCYVEQCGYECIGIADGSDYCVVSNCIAKNGWRTCIQVHRRCHNIKIINNHMIQSSNAWDALFTLHGLSGDDLVVNLRIEGNVFSPSVAPRTRTETAAAVVQLMSSCDGLWFINNRVEDGDRDLFSSDSNSHVFIIGNLFQGDDTTDWRLKINTEDAIIVGNVLENATAGQVIIANGAVMSGNIGFD